MSFLKIRTGASEGKFFKEESQRRAADLRKTLEQSGKLPPGSAVNSGENSRSLDSSAPVDVLPEILRHQLPLSAPADVAVEIRTKLPAAAERDEVMKSFAGGQQQAGGRQGGAVGGNVLRPFSELPQAQFGRKKYTLLHASELPSPVAATANMRRGPPAVDPKAAAAMGEGLLMVSKAFGIATLLVYGGGTLVALATFRAMGIQTLEEIPTKGREALEPRMRSVRERIEPWKEKIQETVAGWKMTEEQRQSVGGGFAKNLGVTSRE